MGWDTICSSSNHPAYSAPLVLHRYVEMSLVVVITYNCLCPIHLGLDIPTDVLSGAIPLDQLGIENFVTGMETATYAILSSFTVLVTGLIAIRLLLARRQYMKIMPGKRLDISNME